MMLINQIIIQRNLNNLFKTQIYMKNLKKWRIIKIHLNKFKH